MRHTQRYQCKVYVATKRNLIMITTELFIHISISSWLLLLSIYSMNESCNKLFVMGGDCNMFGITPRFSQRCPQSFNWNSNNMESITAYNVMYYRGGGGRSNEDANDSESYDEYDGAEDGDDDDVDIEEEENNNDDDEVDEDSLKRQIPDLNNVEAEENYDVDEEDVEDDDVEVPDNTKKESNKNEVFGLESNEYDDNDDITRSSSSDNISQDISSQDGQTTTVMEGIVHLTYSTIESFGRLLGNVFRGETNDETVDDILKKLNRIWHGAFDSSSEKMIQIDEKQLTPRNIQQNDHVVNENKNVLEKVTTSITKPNINSNNVNNDYASNFGTSLAKSYNVMATRNDLENDSTDIIPILGGSFYDALKYARSKARLLAILIPSAAPNNKDKADYDAITSFLSTEVATVAEGKAIKSKKNTKSSNDIAQQIGIPQQKSFILWSAKAGSTEALTAIKRIQGIQIKNPKTNKKRPILAVIYPAGQIDKVYPKLLSQHHCSPPPLSDNMAGWLNSIRKRCLIQYTTMHTEIVEVELYKQRQQGYVSSIQEDKQRQIREEQEEKERIKRTQMEKEYKEKMIQRRIELKQLLPSEPSVDETTTMPIVTIALRFADGRPSTPRRFLSSASLLSDIFNWIDVEYDIEREMIELLYTTKGQIKSFKWNDNDNNIHKTLSDIGFNKMVALRVVVIATTKEQKCNTVTSTTEIVQ